MQAVRQLGGGLIYGLVSVVLVVGGLSLALAENAPPTHLTPTSSLPAVPQTLTPTQPGFTEAPTWTASPTQTPPPPANCPPPPGWTLVAVQSGDTLENLAARYHTSADQIRQGNCLLTSSLAVGYGIYVPYIPPQFQPTPVILCGPFPGWVRNYIVQPGDDLFRIALRYGATTADMQRANCITNPNALPVGLQLWVPNVPTITPGITFIPQFNTQTEVPTEPLTLTPLPFTATIVSTNTSIPNTSTTVPTFAPTPTPTSGPTSTFIPPTATITAFPTATP